MKKIVSVIVENDGYLVKNNSDDGAFTRVMPQGIQRIPCIPFYHSAWLVMGQLLKPAVTDFVDVVNSQYGKIKSTCGMVAYPADALPADVRMIEQTLEYAGFSQLKLVSKTSLMKAEGITNYIAISASERLVILEWYRDGVPTESRYYNKMSVGRKRLLGDIDKIQKRQAGSNLKVFVFDSCEELMGLYNVGELVDENRAIKLLVKTGYEQYKVKNPPQINWAGEKKDTQTGSINTASVLDINAEDAPVIAGESGMRFAHDTAQNTVSADGTADNAASVAGSAAVTGTSAIKEVAVEDETKQDAESDLSLEARLAMDISKAEEEFDEWAYKQAMGEEE